MLNVNLGKMEVIKDIGHIQFGLFSADEIVKNSVCKISNNKMSGEGSIYDERMGTLDFSKSCVSCGLESKDCPGHFGHIELNYPFLHPMYHRMIVNFLKCFCTKCNKFLITEEHLKIEGLLKYQKDIRFNKILEKIEKVDICYHCNTPKSKIVYMSIEGNIYYVIKKNKILVTEDDIKKVFDSIDNDTVRLLGFDPNIIHPKSMVLTVFPILPPISRPYIITDEMTCDDDLTVQYLEIIKANKNLEDKTNENKYQKNIQTLKFRLKTLMNNSQGKARHSSGRPIKAIKERISGKEGIIRSNLNGKRVDQSARTVIGPDPTIRVDELVIPEEVAKTLTIPERVCPFNKEMLEKMIYEDKCAFVIKPNNLKINLKYATVKRGTTVKDYDIIFRKDREILIHDVSKYKPLPGDKIKKETKDGIVWEDIVLNEKRHYKLEIGDVVERYLQNGDRVLLNRQPTLHAGSMLAKKIIIRPGKTFRFNLAATKTFNADFDGDEITRFSLEKTANILVEWNTKVWKSCNPLFKYNRLVVSHGKISQLRGSL
jgi:DNA-directed RNA polymerase beta' subunit